MTALEILLARAPCYQISPQINTLITIAGGQTALSAFGTQRNTAVALLALHWMALSERGRSGSGGAITSETEGSLSRSYSVPQMDSAWDLGSTIWGMELLRLRRSTFFGVYTRMDRGPQIGNI